MPYCEWLDAEDVVCKNKMEYIAKQQRKTQKKSVEKIRINFNFIGEAK
jgi:hypothetical protein